MSRRSESTQLKAAAIPKAQPEPTDNTEMNRQAAEADIPQGSVKNQNKSAGGFSRSN